MLEILLSHAIALALAERLWWVNDSLDFLGFVEKGFFGTV